MEKIDVIEKLDTLREGISYKVFCRGGEKYQIAGIIDKKQPVHTGNLHFIDKTFQTREAALKRIAEYMVSLMRDGKEWTIGREGESSNICFFLSGTSAYVPGVGVRLPFVFTTFGEAEKCHEAVRKYFANETRRQLFC